MLKSLWEAELQTLDEPELAQVLRDLVEVSADTIRRATATREQAAALLAELRPAVRLTVVDGGRHA